MSDKERERQEEQKPEIHETEKLPAKKDNMAKMVVMINKAQYEALWSGIKYSGKMLIDAVSIPFPASQIIDLTDEDFDQKEIQKAYKEEQKLISEQVKEEKELALRKERAIVDLIETAEEVEIEEMGDTNNAFNIGGAFGQAGVSGNLGKENGVSHYRRYKFKRGGETTEINSPSEGKPKGY